MIGHSQDQEASRPRKYHIHTIPSTQSLFPPPRVHMRPAPAECAVFHKNRNWAEKHSCSYFRNGGAAYHPKQCLDLRLRVICGHYPVSDEPDKLCRRERQSARVETEIWYWLRLAALLTELEGQNFRTWEILTVEQKKNPPDVHYQKEIPRRTRSYVAGVLCYMGPNADGPTAMNWG